MLLGVCVCSSVVLFFCLSSSECFFMGCVCLLQGVKVIYRFKELEEQQAKGLVPFLLDITI